MNLEKISENLIPNGVVLALCGSLSMGASWAGGSSIMLTERANEVSMSIEQKVCEYGIMYFCIPLCIGVAMMAAGSLIEAYKNRREDKTYLTTK